MHRAETPRLLGTATGERELMLPCCTQPWASMRVRQVISNEWRCLSRAFCAHALYSGRSWTSCRGTFPIGRSGGQVRSSFQQTRSSVAFSFRPPSSSPTTWTHSPHLQPHVFLFLSCALSLFPRRSLILHACTVFSFPRFPSSLVCSHQAPEARNHPKDPPSFSSLPIPLVRVRKFGAFPR